MRLEARYGRDQRADTGGDPHCDDQDIVHNQRRCGQQASAGTQIFASHRIGSAASRIGGDGLQVRDVDNDKKRNNAEADGDDVLDTQGAERNQQGERGFRAVSRGAERIQSEHSDARQGAEALFRVFVCGQWLAEQEIAEGHRNYYAVEERARRTDVN